MPRYRATIATARPREEAFRYMASFDNVAEWDPGVVEAERLDSGQIERGSRFRVVVSAASRKLPLDYEVTSFEPPGRVVLVAETPLLRSTDEITVDSTPEGAAVTYDADLELLGFLRVFNPILALAFKRTGDRAADGLKARLQG